jgi:hypothetical protein
MRVNITHYVCAHHTLCMWTSHTMRVNITHYACGHLTIYVSSENLLQHNCWPFFSFCGGGGGNYHHYSLPTNHFNTQISLRRNIKCGYLLWWKMKNWQPCNFFVCHLAASKKSVCILIKNSHYANFHQVQRRSSCKKLSISWKILTHIPFLPTIVN